MLLKLLKIASLILTSVIGVYGTTHEFRKHGKLTQSGRFAVVGLIILALVAVALQFLEFNKEAQSAEIAKRELDDSTARQNAAIARTEEANKALSRVIVDLDRGLHPIQSVNVSCRLYIATESERAKEYVDRVKRTAPRTSEALSAFDPSPETGIFGSASTPGTNTLEAITFTTRSKLAPGPKEHFVRALFGPVWLEFEFFREPIDPSKSPFVMKEAVLPEEPDLSFLVPVGSDRGEAWQKFGINYEITSGKFHIEFSDVDAAPSTWRSSGRIVGIPDLEGTQMFVRIKSYMRMDEPAADRVLRQLQRATEITSTLILSINGGRSCYLNVIEKLESPNGDPVYVFVFPKGEEFKRLVR